MTTYHIETIYTDIDTTQGVGEWSDPEFFRLTTAIPTSTVGVVPGMVTQDQKCYRLLDTSLYPLVKDGYGKDIGLTSVEFNYNDVAVSKTTGQYMLIANGFRSELQFSSDYGVSWERKKVTTSGTTQNFNSCCISDSGQYMAASSGSGLYTSSDYGVTWTKGNGGYLRDLCMSSDGSKVVGKTNSSVNRSTDYGVNFTQIHSYPTPGTFISDVACSADGTYISFTAYQGYIYVSDDAGLSWNTYATDSIRWWMSIDMSADGQTQVASFEDGGNGSVWKSTNYGVTWAYDSSVAFPEDIAITSDGTDYEATNQPAYYMPISMTADGTIRIKLYRPDPYVGGSDGDYYISTDSGSTYNLIEDSPPTTYDLINRGGVYGISLELDSLEKYYDSVYKSSGWSTPSAQATPTTADVDDFAEEMCDYFEGSKDSLVEKSDWATVNLYLIVSTIDGDTSWENKCYVPIFYFGNNINADRTYVPA